MDTYFTNIRWLPFGTQYIHITTLYMINSSSMSVTGVGKHGDHQQNLCYQAVASTGHGIANLNADEYI